MAVELLDHTNRNSEFNRPSTPNQWVSGDQSSLILALNHGHHGMLDGDGFAQQRDFGRGKKVWEGIRKRSQFVHGKISVD